MKKYFLILIMLLFSMIWATSARAYPITLDEVGVVPAQVVKVKLLYDDGSTFYSGGVYVGAYQVEIDGVTTYSYCIDYLHFAPTSPTSYNLVDLASGVKYDNLEYKRAAWIMQNYNPATSTNAQRVNAQLAIWEILSPDAGTLGSGKVSVTAWSGYGSLANAQAIVNDLLALDSNYFDTFDTSSFQLATNATYQDYIVPAPVPEPTTILLLGSGLIGVAVLRKRLKR